MKSFFFAICILTFSSCGKNSIDNENCKFLLDIDVNISVNLNLPQYSQLQFAGNSIYIANGGNGGVILASTGVDIYAWDASDPNEIPSTETILEASGLEASCPCNNTHTYSLVTGQALNNSTLQCTLRNYRVEKSGNTLLISN